MTTRLPCPAPAFASPLASGLQRFLESKRAAGYRYDTEAQALGPLDRFLEGRVAPDDPVISSDVIRDFVARRGRESDTTRGHRLSLIRQVCRFLALEQPRTAVPGPHFLPIVRGRFLARVLSREEGRRFLHACQTVPTAPWAPLRPTTLGTALVLLYLTGLRAGEVLRLTDADVDLDVGILRIRDTKFGKSRCVPVAADVTAHLRRCRAAVAGHLDPRRPDALFFPTAGGTPSAPSARPSIRSSTRRTSRVGAAGNRSGCMISDTHSSRFACSCGTSRASISMHDCRSWRPTWGTSA